MNRYTALLLLLLASFGVGCQTHEIKIRDITKNYVNGNPGKAAAQFGGQANKAGENQKIIWHLEAGSTFRAVNNSEQSDFHFHQASDQIEIFEDSPEIKPFHEGWAFISNQQQLPYEGKACDKIMLYTYRALNYLALGEIDKAAPELRRAYRYQETAVDDNARRIEKVREDEEKYQSSDSRRLAAAQADPKVMQEQQEIDRDFEGFKFYADYVNPFTVYLDGLYFLYAGVDGDDLERARKSLARVHEFVESNKFVTTDLELAENGGPDSTTPPCTYVVFETGRAPNRVQTRIDIPIFVSSVPYIGAAFPRLNFHGNHATGLTVRSGELEEQTALIANMDAVVGLEFKNEWSVILSKTIISTFAKTAVAAAAMEAAKRSGDRREEFAARLVLIALQAIVNIADTRCWNTLPKEFQAARIPTPPDRKLTLSTAGGDPVEVTLIEGEVNVVYVKSISATSPLLINQFKLK